MLIRDEVVRLPAYRFAHHPQPVKLDQNEAPGDEPGVSSAALSRLGAAHLNRYPDLHPVELEAALAARHGWDPRGVVAANGSNVLIQALILAAGLGRSVVTVSPTFSVYPSQAVLLGCQLVEVPLGEGFSLPEHGLTEALRSGSGGVMFLADPAAPTGNRMDPDGLERVLAAAGATGRWLVVLDEAYAEFAGFDHAGAARRFDCVVLLRTLSKAAGLAGLRLGYLLTRPELAEHLRKVLLPFCVSSVQVAIALAALEAQEIVAARVDAAVAERERLSAALGRLPGVHPYPSVTNFVLFRVQDAARIHASLLDRGVVIRRQDHLPGLGGCLRVSVGTPEENDAFLAALETALREPTHA